MGLALLVILFVVFLLFGMPISLVIGCSALVYLVIENISLLQISQIIKAYTFQYILLSVPLFIVAANLMMETSMTRRIIRVCNCLVGFMRGGLSQVNIGSSMVFAGVSGAAIADVSSIGAVMWKSMVENGYKSPYAAAVTAASAAVGPVIPPSIPMIVAGSIANVSVAKLFAAGIVPGILMGVGMGIVAYIAAVMYNHPSQPFGGLAEIGRALKEGFFDLLMPVVVIGGILFGFTTPTEAAALAVAYALLMGVMRRELGWSVIKRCCISTVSTTAEVLFIASMATLLGWILVRGKIPFYIVEWGTSFSVGDAGMYFFIVVVSLILGCFLSSMESLLIALPLFLPVAESLGMDLFHVTLVVVLATNIGTLTPPVGLTLYIISSISKDSVWAITKAMTPFLLVNIAVVFFVAYFPQIAYVTLRWLQ